MSRPVFLDSRRDLLTSLIDYAGLYPPASLALTEAVAEYRNARAGPHSWMLGAFVINASLLEDLAGALVSTMRHDEAPWDVSVILDGELATSASRAATFNAEMTPAARIVIVEAALPREVTAAADATAAALVAAPTFSAAAAVSTSVMPFLEIPAITENRQVELAVSAIAELCQERHRPAGAKLRCGGLTSEAFPEPSIVASFLVACRDRSLPYKATAGLHRPVRHFDPELGVTRHGFLNLLVAAAIAESGADISTVAEIVSEVDASAFGVGAAGISWRGTHASGPIVARTRSERFASYGSCSFDESVTDLANLGLLAGTPV
jgi:hypothetical protein